jgi:hypothetical protein
VATRGARLPDRVENYVGFCDPMPTGPCKAPLADRAGQQVHVRYLTRSSTLLGQQRESDARGCASAMTLRSSLEKQAPLPNRGRFPGTRSEGVSLLPRTPSRCLHVLRTQDRHRWESRPGIRRVICYLGEPDVHVRDVHHVLAHALRSQMHA